MLKKRFYHLILARGFLLPPYLEGVTLIGGSILQIGLGLKITFALTVLRGVEVIN
jgi:hypothetical protein